METITTAGTSDKQPGLLYPLMLIAAIALIVFSIVGIATMMGWMPSTMSPRSAPDRTGAAPAPSPPAARLETAPCPDCGVVESIRASDGSAGMKGTVTYQIRVRMSDGATRTFNEAGQPGLAVGQRVRITERGIAAAG
jgi:hypothetical protein